VLRVLPERFGKYGLSLHPEKTRLVHFKRPDRSGPDDPGTFDLLGFTFFWALSRRGKWIVKQKTAKDRFRRAVRRVAEWCRAQRHTPVAAQHVALSRKLRGHYGYFGVTSNHRMLARFWHQVKGAWKRALARRSQRGLSWKKMQQLLQRYPLPRPRIVHRYGH